MTTVPITKHGPRVRALHTTTTKTLYVFPRLSAENPAVSLSLGSGDECHVRIDDAAVAKVHCFLVCTRDSVTLRRFKDNPVTINNVKMAEGEIELSVNNVITLSDDSELVVCDERLVPTPEITVVDLGEFVRRAQELYENPSKAAEGVNVPRRTFANWIETKRFVRPVVTTIALCVVLVTGHALQSSAPEEEQPMLPAAAASTAAMPSIDLELSETSEPTGDPAGESVSVPADGQNKLEQTDNTVQNEATRAEPEQRQSDDSDEVTKTVPEKRRRSKKRARDKAKTQTKPPGDESISTVGKPTFQGRGFTTGRRFLGGSSNGNGKQGMAQ